VSALAAPAFPDLLGTSPADLIDRVVDRPVATLDEARQRADRLRAGLVRYSEMRQDIADAYACRDWLALDYGSWYEYVKGEFGQELRQLSRTERSAAVQDLRTQGMSTRQIASATGAARNTVAAELAQTEPPDRITGTDGKSYPAARPSTSAGRDLPPAPEAKPEPAVDPERPKPSAAVREQIDNDPDVQAAEFMRRFTGVLRASVDLSTFDAGRVAQLADATVIELLDRHVTSVARFAEAVKRARTGLHLIQGGAS